MPGRGSPLCTTDHLAFHVHPTAQQADSLYLTIRPYGALYPPDSSATREDVSGSSGSSRGRSGSDEEDSDDEKEAPCNVKTVFPRRKQGQYSRTNSKPVVLDEATLSQFYTLPLHQAALKLGISNTAMKGSCRKLGIKRWPYRALCVPTKSQRVHRACTLAKSASHGSSSRSRATSSVNTMCPLDESDMTRDAMLLAEAMLLLQKSAHRDESSPTAQLLHPNISASSSGCSSEISGASTRHCEHYEDSVDSSPSGLRGGGASACSSSWTAQPLSVASLLN